MRRNLFVGILKETKEGERRVPLTPQDVNWLIKRGIGVEVESSKDRVFKDAEYREYGATIVKGSSKADLLVGVKEPELEKLEHDKIYMVFSHTVKGQSQNMSLLAACLRNRLTLIDYEKITDIHNKRLVYFGRFAGIAGMVDSLYYLGKKLKYLGINNPFTCIKRAHEYATMANVKRGMEELDRLICKKGLDKRISPFIVGITGHGNVSKAAQEVLEFLNPLEIHPRDMVDFVKRGERMKNRIYKIVFLREEKFRSKKRKGFYFEEYLSHPEKFESNLDTYIPYLNMLIHTSYWDKRYPRMITKKMIDKLSQKKPFRLKFIGDISCDVKGGIELTYKTTTRENPVFTYNPKMGTYVDGYKTDGLSLMAIDNLPSELPRDSSKMFSQAIREYIYQIAVHGVSDITNHAAIPKEVRKAVITQGGKLMSDYRYLEKWLKKKKTLQFSQ